MSAAAASLDGWLRPAPPDDDALRRLCRLAAELVGARSVYLHLDTGCAPDGLCPPDGEIADLCRSAAQHALAREARLRDAESGCVAVCVPLPAPATRPIGSLCAVVPAARASAADQRGRLADVAELIARELAARPAEMERIELENTVRVLSKAVENMQLGVTVTDMEGRIIYTNPAEARMHGYELPELIGRHARMLGPPELCRALEGEQLDAAGSWTRESVNVRKDGSRFPVLLWSDLVTDASGRAIGIVTCCEDITHRKHAELALREGALRDPLTLLPNRTHFLERLTRAIEAARQSDDHRFAVLFLDLDRFKVVNDSLGHHVGDELLGVIAQRLKASLRPTDLVARFGGDEFAVLLEGVAEIADATLVAERIHQELAAPVQLNGYELYTSASIGIVLSSPMIDQPEYLWRSADMAMYRAKAAGAGRFEVFDRAMHADALARLQLETDLRRSVGRDEFRLHYQPVVELATGQIVGFEALLRWEHPLRGLISPAEVIPAAEETGLILPIGEWVLREAARQLSAWREVLPADRPLWLSVNLSGKQLLQFGLTEQVESAIRDHGIPPCALKLEITESAVVESSQTATDLLRALKALGVQLYMDDFGTGYSSLSYLHRLPLDAIKIDRSFVSQMERGDKHAQLVSTIMSLAHSTGLTVVAEGITSVEQLSILRELGCQLGQGFYFSPPLVPAEAERLLRSPAPW